MLPLFSSTLLWLTLGAAPGPRTDAQAVADLASQALAGDHAAVASLRALGPAGLDGLIALRDGLSSVPPFPSEDARALKWAALIDEVAQQRDASASGLYWYTDLAQAEAAAQREGKPIVSLRLLGNLDEVLSCANSRFFRALLYPDADVKTALHDHYILHWESVRKAPKITIDFGDGRVLTRTVTGNSLHYMLDAKGRVVDALPGLVGPAAFTRWLGEVGPATLRLGALSDARFVAARTTLHATWLASRQAALRDALAKVGIALPLGANPAVVASDPQNLERLGRLRPDALRIQSALQSQLVARDIGPDTRPTALDAAPLAMTKAVVESPMLRLMQNLGSIIAADETRNDYVLHAEIDALFARRADVDPKPFTEQIYAGVFLTPLDDPFMGLAPADMFSAIPPAVERGAEATARNR